MGMELIMLSVPCKDLAMRNTSFFSWDFFILISALNHLNC